MKKVFEMCITRVQKFGFTKNVRVSENERKSERDLSRANAHGTTWNEVRRQTNEQRRQDACTEAKERALVFKSHSPSYSQQYGLCRH